MPDEKRHAPNEPRDPAAQLPLSEPVFELLLALVDADRHGYGIMQEVEVRTGGRVRMGPGTLYGAIKRLRAEGLVEEVDGDDATTDARRRYYRLTPFGHAVAGLEARRLERVLEGARAKRLLPEGGAA